MTTTFPLFLHSQVTDPYPMYHRCLTDSPVYWDGDQQIWSVYSYRHCQSDHDTARQITSGLFRQMRPVPIPHLINRLLAGQSRSFDWVDVVCRRLPVIYILASFGFTEEDEDFILVRMPMMLQLMQSTFL